jgi:hypothetical protein
MGKNLVDEIEVKSLVDQGAGTGQPRNLKTGACIESGATVVKINQTLSTMIVATTVQPRILSQGRLANSPILALSSAELHAENDLAGDEQGGRAAFAIVTHDSDGGNDGEAPGHQPPEPWRETDIEKPFHDDLSGQRAGEGRVLSGSE